MPRCPLSRFLQRPEDLLLRKAERGSVLVGGSGDYLQLIQTADADAKVIMEDLLAGKSFTAHIDEQIVFNQLVGNTNAIWPSTKPW